MNQLLIQQEVPASTNKDIPMWVTNPPVSRSLRLSAIIATAAKISQEPEIDEEVVMLGS